MELLNTEPDITSAFAFGRRSRSCTGSITRPRRASLLAIVACALLVVASGSAARGYEANQEYAVKAAFIYNFANFVEWPSASFEAEDSPIVIGIVGKDPFEGAIDRAVQGKSVNRHPFLVKRLRWGQDLKSCHILFVSASEKDGVEKASAAVKGGSVLTVGERGGFASHGGVVNFILDQGRVRFEINPDAARRAHLTLSSRLLSLAKIVSDAK